jgi:hypothetical protein
MDGIVDTIAERLESGGETKTFQTAARSDCSRQACQVRRVGNAVAFGGYNILGQVIYCYEVDFFYEVDGCDVFNGTVGLNTLKKRPLDIVDFRWTQKVIETTGVTGCPDCCEGSRCVMVDVEVEISSGLNVFRLLGLGSNKIVTIKVSIFGSGSILLLPVGRNVQNLPGGGC